MEHAIVLHRYSSRALAEVARSKLDANRIESRVVVDDGGGQYPGLGMARGVDLVIDPRQLKRAKKVLALAG